MAKSNVAVAEPDSATSVKNPTWKRKPTEKPDKSNEEDIGRASETPVKKAKLNVKSKKGGKKGLPAMLAKWDDSADEKDASNENVE